MPSKRSEKGQVLLLSVIALLILLIAVFMLFDVQNTIRFKIKSQNGADAAALAGARWQMHTLNAIGELNLIKASTMLLSEDIFLQGQSAGDFLRVEEQECFDEIDMNQRYGTLKAAAAALSQMQYRMLFIGPMIGVAAAQQAAKNNGVPGNPDIGEAVTFQLDMINSQNSYSTIFARYKEDEFVRKELFGFKWYEPYISMLNSILNKEGEEAYGFAVLMNGHLLGTPRVYADPKRNPDFTSFLTDKNFFSSLESEAWCYLIDFLEKMEKTTDSKWWGDLKVDMDDSFRAESEYLPVGVRIGPADRNVYESILIGEKLFETSSKNREETLAAIKGKENYSVQDWSDPFTDGDTDQRLNPLPVIDWAYYKDSWADYGDEYTALWSDYLTKPLRAETAYKSGAVARADTRMKNYALMGTYGSNSGAHTIGSGLDAGGRIFSGYSSSRNAVNRLNNLQNTMRTPALSISANALAKPFGALSVNDTLKPPHYSRVVLPVFDKTAILPVSMEDPGLLGLLSDFEWYRFLIFYIPALGKVSSLDELPEDLKQSFKLHHALLKNADNPEWRAKGTLWLSAPSYSDLEKTNRDKCFEMDDSDVTYVPGKGTGGKTSTITGGSGGQTLPLPMH